MKNERGQAIVLVALALVGLLAIGGLAIDGGRLYQSRRQVQNAADAAALAGARVILDGVCSGGAERSAVSAAIQDFARQNGVDITSPDATYIYQYVDGNENILTPTTSKVPVETKGISITVMLTETTTFMKIVGWNEMTAPAFAMAMVGPITQLPAGSSLLPIAVPDEILYQLNPGDDIYIDNDAICSGEGAAQQCVEDPAGGPQSQRGWLNFGDIYNIAHYEQSDPLRRTHSLNMSANALKAVVTLAAGGTPSNPPSWLGTPPQIPPIIVGTPPNPWPDHDGNSQYYIDGDYINGGTGQQQAVMGNIYDELAGQTAYLPVFDKVYLVDYLTGHSGIFPTPYVEDPSGPWPNPNSANNYFYHIIGFIAVELPDPAPHPAPQDIEATLLNIQIGAGQIDPTQPIQCSSALTAVILWK
jgi:hypothetical protein